MFFFVLKLYLTFAGARAFSPGLDWIHGEPLHNVRGCPEGSGSDISGSKCVWIGLQSGTKEGVYNISSEWHLPTEGHLLYPVELHLNIWSEETHCGTYSLPAETYSFLLPNDVRAYDMEGLTPGIIYNFQIAYAIDFKRAQFGLLLISDKFENTFLLEVICEYYAKRISSLFR